MLVEGELSPEATRRLEEHLKTCEDCLAEFNKLKSEKRLIEACLQAGMEYDDDASNVALSAMEAGPPGRLRGRRFLKKALIGVAASIGIVVLSAYLFFHFYFGRTFSHEISARVIRCTDGILARESGRKWSPLKPGRRLNRGTRIKTSQDGLSFISFDGVRLLTRQASEIEIKGVRRFSLVEGDVAIAAADKRKPLVISFGNSTLSTNDSVLKVTGDDGSFEVDCISGDVSVKVGKEKGRRLVAAQTATIGDKTIHIAASRVEHPFAAFNASVIERVRERFDRVMSKYAHRLPIREKSLQMGHLESEWGWGWNRSGWQFASYAEGNLLNMARRDFKQFVADYYDAFFNPSNRKLSIGRQKVVPMPPGKAGTFPRWSSDGSMIVFIETYPGALVGTAKLVSLDDLDHPWDVSQGQDTVRPMFPPTWAPDDEHVLFQMQTGEAWDRKGPTANFKIRIAPIDPEAGPLRDFESPFYDIPLPLPLPVGKNISPGIEKLPWGNVMVCSNWGNLAYIPVEDDGQSVSGAPGLFLTDFDPRDVFVMGGGFSPSGNMMAFTGVKNFNFDGMIVFLVYDAEDIIDGFSEPPRSLDDPRIKRIAPTANMQFTGGFSYDESLAFFHEDVNRAFDARWPTNVTDCDFDIFYGNALQGEPGMPTQIHMPGSQMFLTPSPEGNRIVYCNFEGNKREMRVVSFEVEVDIDADLGGVLIDNSGTNLIIPPGALEENFNVQITTPFSIEEETEPAEGESHFFAMRLLGIEGLENPEFSEPMTLTIRYTDEEVGGLDEGMLDIYYYDESDPDNPRWVPLGATVDPEHNEITVEIRHFSKFSVGGHREDEQ